MGSDMSKDQQAVLDAVENQLDNFNNVNLADQNGFPFQTWTALPNMGDVSLPNIVDLTMSTPVKDEPEVKVEPVSMASTPVSLPALTEVRKRPRSILSDLTNSSTTRSITLGSEPRSLDTSTSNMENTRPPTPIVISPPQKIRRSTRRQESNK